MIKAKMINFMPIEVYCPRVGCQRNICTWDDRKGFSGNHVARERFECPACGQECYLPTNGEARRRLGNRVRVHSLGTADGSPGPYKIPPLSQKMEQEDRKRWRTGYRCRQCLGVSDEHANALGIRHKMDCSYEHEIRKCVERTQYEVEHNLPFSNEGKKYYITRW